MTKGQAGSIAYWPSAKEGKAHLRGSSSLLGIEGLILLLTRLCSVRNGSAGFRITVVNIRNHHLGRPDHQREVRLEDHQGMVLDHLRQRLQVWKLTVHRTRHQPEFFDRHMHGAVRGRLWRGTLE